MEEYKKKYPLLKDTVRIKKLPNFCWIIELTSDCNTSIAPIEAFLLAHCTGEWTLEQIYYLFQETYHLNSDDAEPIVSKVFQELNDCIQWQEQKSSHAIRYHPTEFLYETKLGVLAEQERCDTPCEMYLSLTNLCNFQCIYCFNSSGQKKQAELAPEEWISLIRQAKDLDVLKCTLTGGEPMLYSGFYDILTALVQSDILPYLCTNGSLIDAEAIARFRQLGIPALQISMDTSNPDIHHQLTATKDTFYQIAKAIENLSKAGIQVNVKTVLTPYNLKGISEFVHFCSTIGVKKLTFDRFDVGSSGRGGSELLITEAQMEEVRETILANKDHLSGGMKVEAVSSPKHWKEEKDIVFCAAFRRSFVVLANGDVSVCEKLIGVPEMIAGNIKEESLLSIWNSKRISDILCPPLEKLEDTCTVCEYFNQCKTGCFAIKHFLHKGLYSIDPRCWKASPIDNPYAQL